MTSLLENTNTSLWEADACAICQEDIDPKNKKIVHENAKKWRHQFCGPCIDDWIKACLKKEKNPTCPLCPDFKIPKQLFPIAAVESDYDIAHEAALERYNHIMCDYEHTGIMPIFMGIMICINGNYICKLSNYDMGLTMSSSVQDIKTWIGTKGKQIYMISGFTSQQNVSHNLSLWNWLQWKYPTIRVANIDYGTPLTTDINENLHDATLEQIYIKYQTLIGMIHLNSDYHSEVVQHHVRKIYRRSNLEWNHPTGPDDPGHYDRAYHNENNPVIPRGLRAYTYNDRATDHSLAWLTVHIEYE
jgi:hypothetical protein